VRELISLVERAVTLADGEVIEIDDLPERIQTNAGPLPDTPPQALPPTRPRAEDWETLAEREASYVREVLAFTGGNKQQAARILGIGRKTLYRKIDEGL
jgi:DNA-binding NtrC family response regulator